MKLPPFRLHRPKKLMEALDLLSEFDDNSAFYMGGTEILLLMKLGFSSPEHLVDGKNIVELTDMRIRPDEVSLGAGITHRRLAQHRDLQRLLPAFTRLEENLANVRVRNVGTLGGNICFAEPHSDPMTLLIALGATVDLVSHEGIRNVPLENFCTGAFTTQLGLAELLQTIRVPLPDRATQVGYERIAFKERPDVTAAVVLGPGVCNIIVGSIGPTPIRIDSAEAILLDGGDGAVKSAVAAIRDEISSRNSGDGDDYMTHLAGVMFERAYASATRHQP